MGDFENQEGFHIVHLMAFFQAMMVYCYPIMLIIGVNSCEQDEWLKLCAMGLGGTIPSVCIGIASVIYSVKLTNKELLFQAATISKYLVWLYEILSILFTGFLMIYGLFEGNLLVIVNAIVFNIINVIALLGGIPFCVKYHILRKQEDTRYNKWVHILLQCVFGVGTIDLMVQSFLTKKCRLWTIITIAITPILLLLTVVVGVIVIAIVSGA